MIEKLKRDVGSPYDVVDKINEIIDILNKANELKKGDEYWSILDGEVKSTGWDNDQIDRYRELKGNVFRTKQEADEALEKELIELNLIS